MVEHRKFAVVLVGNGNGAGADMTEVPNAEIDYDGKEIQTTVQ
jgi:hypothetical protein